MFSTLNVKNLITGGGGVKKILEGSFIFRFEQISTTFLNGARKNSGWGKNILRWGQKLPKGKIRKTFIDRESVYVDVM